VITVQSKHDSYDRTAIFRTTVTVQSLQESLGRIAVMVQQEYDSHGYDVDPELFHIGSGCGFSKVSIGPGYNHPVI
jgi:hypothetical protein